MMVTVRDNNNDREYTISQEEWKKWRERGQTQSGWKKRFTVIVDAQIVTKPTASHIPVEIKNMREQRAKAAESKEEKTD